MDTYITPKETAELLRIHQNQVYKLCNENALPGAKKLGGSWRIDTRALDNYFAGGTAEDESKS